MYLRLFWCLKLALHAIFRLNNAVELATYKTASNFTPHADKMTREEKRGLHALVDGWGFRQRKWQYRLDQLNDYLGRAGDVGKSVEGMLAGAVSATKELGDTLHTGSSARSVRSDGARDERKLRHEAKADTAVAESADSASSDELKSI